MRLVTPRHLRARGVLGMNGRNARYVADQNASRLMPRVNDKIATKRIAEAAGVPTPRLHGVVEIQAQAKPSRFERILGEVEDFVIKPALGAQGDGILVIGGRHPKGWARMNGDYITERALAFHISNVLSGMYSLNGLADVAMVEERIVFSDCFDDVANKGVPDIRVIAYKGVPCMAMARVPTRISDGKANLHKGGIGLGIDIATGQSTRAVFRDRLVTEHPDTGLPISPVAVPGWGDILMMASRCYDEIGLGYLGVDIVIDRNRGPLLLELNARPGLAVQLANGEGLQPRLDAVDAAGAGSLSAADRVSFATDRFRSARSEPRSEAA